MACIRDKHEDASAQVQAMGRLHELVEDQAGMSTYMKAAPELTVSPQLDVYPLIEAELYQIKWLLHCGVLIGHALQQALAASDSTDIA